MSPGQLTDMNFRQLFHHLIRNSPQLTKSQLFFLVVRESKKRPADLSRLLKLWFKGPNFKGINAQKPKNFYAIIYKNKNI